MPPDFFLNPQDKERDLLEVKAFNRRSNPGFDIADFRAYEEEIIKQPYMLYVDYLIFGYDMSDEGVVTIKDLWLKKVWEITRTSEKWPLNLQVKQGVVHKIRPGMWYSTKESKMPMFKSLEHFLSAIEETMYQDGKTHNAAPSWKRDFLASYRKYYKKDLVIPHWDSIVGEYKSIDTL